MYDSKHSPSRAETARSTCSCDSSVSLSEEIIRSIVFMGCWAPSGDNIQPWRFVWDGQVLHLFEDTQRSQVFYDVESESLLVSFGACIENLKIAASYYGYEISWQLSPLFGRTDEIALVTFYPSDRAADPLYSHLLDRCVNRNPFKRRAIAKENVWAMNSEIAEIEGLNFRWIEDKEERHALRRANYLADRVLFEHERLHGDLFKWIKMERGSAAGSDGMGLDVLGLNCLDRLIFPLFADWKLLTRLNKGGLSRIVAVRSLGLLLSSRGYACLSTKDRSPSGYLAGGMGMERIWIRANALGLQVQPMSGFIFLLNHLNKNDALGFSVSHKQMLREIECLVAFLGRNESPENMIMFFRMGYGSPPAARTARRSVDEVLSIETESSVVALS